MPAKSRKIFESNAFQQLGRFGDEHFSVTDDKKAPFSLKTMGNFLNLWHAAYW